MGLSLKHVDYRTLNSRQQEAHNFQKVSALLADYGYITIKLDSDWQGADFIAQHYEDPTFLKVQLKSRLTFDRKYHDKDLYVCFPSAGEWYLFHHDTLLAAVLDAGVMATSSSWLDKGGYSFPRIPNSLLPLLEPYRLIPKPLALTAAGG